MEEIKDILENHSKRLESKVDIILKKVNEKLTSVLDVNNMLLKENIKLKKQLCPPSSAVTSDNHPTPPPAPSDFQSVYMSPTDYGYRIWGKTFDVKDTIKTLGNTSFDSQTKSWQLRDVEIDIDEIRTKMSKVCKFEILPK